MDQIDHLATLASLQSRFATELAEADPSAPVPSCGSWTVTELADHLGSVHVWAASRCTDQLPESEDSAGLATMADRYAVRADLLLSTLREVPPHRECTTLTGRGPVSFWHRRQAHETLIHLWDLHTALGTSGPDVAAEVWGDCIDEVVHVMYPRQITKGRATAPDGQLQLHASDLGRSWQLGSAARQDHSAQVTGPASALALMLWGRADQDSVTVAGEASVLETFLTEALTP